MTETSANLTKDDTINGSRLLTKTLSLSIPNISAYVEAERIRRCFLPGFCLGSIRKLPHAIYPGAINANKDEMLLENKLKKIIPKKKNVLENGFFNPLKYQYSDFDAAEQKSNNDKEQHRLLTESFGRKPFKVSNGRIRKRYEDMLLECPDKLVDSGPPVEKINLETLVRSYPNNVLDSSLLNRPAFHPPALTISKEDEGRTHISEWMKELYHELSTAWPHLRFNLKFTLTDEFIISFAINKEKELSVLRELLFKYMNNLARNGLAAFYKFKRRGDRWNILEEESKENNNDEETSFRLIFTFYAPWVRNATLKVHKAAAQSQRKYVKSLKASIDLNDPFELF
jgi:hypothetical protein